jgi:hypothetical protein
MKNRLAADCANAWVGEGGGVLQDCVRFDMLHCVQNDRDSAPGALFGVMQDEPFSVRLIEDHGADIECRHFQSWAAGCYHPTMKQFGCAASA